MKRMFAAALAAVCAAGLARADWTWNGGNNADLSDSSNWTGSSGNYLFNASVSGLYLSQDWSCPTNFMVSSDGVTVSLALGADRTLSLSSTQHVSLMGCDNSTFELTSGKIDHPAGREIYLLSPSSPNKNKNYTNNTFRITGQGTILQTFNKAVVSAKGSGGKFEIADGAEFKGGIRFYDNNNTDQTVLVSTNGTLTSYMSYGASAGACAYPSQTGGGRGIRTVVDGGTLTATYLNFANNEWSFEVKNGGKAQFSKNGMVIGSGSSFNVVEIGDGGVFEEKSTNNGLFTIGNGAGATGNVVRVLSGGVLRFTDAFDDDAPCSYGKFQIGYSEAVSNRVEVLGGTLITDRVYVGGDVANKPGDGNALVVSNGTMKTWHVAFSPRGGNNMLDIAGTTSAITTQSQLVFTNTVVTLDFADGKYTSIPLQAEAGTLVFNAGTTFALKNIKPAVRAGGGSVTIARRTAGAITIASGLLDAWNAALAADEATEGCAFSLANGNKDLVLKLPAPKGLAIIVR